MIAEQQAAKDSGNLETDLDWSSTAFTVPMLPAATTTISEDLDQRWRSLPRSLALRH